MAANDTTPLIEKRSIDYIPEAERHGRLLSQDRKSTRLNSSHGYNSYAVFCLKKNKKKKKKKKIIQRYNIPYHE